MTVTIDAAIQQKAYEQFQGDPAMAVSINPKTGEVMALVSTPAYDPNEFVYGISDRRWTELNEDPNRPLLNRFYAALVPGSTFKPITAAIGMDAGKLDPNENKGYVGLSWQKDASWGEYMVTTLTDYGSEVNLQNALVYSDNIYFARAALDIGADTMIEGMRRAGFEEELPFDIGAQVSTFGTDSKISSEIQLADTGYGQGELLVNPIHLASIYSAFVNEEYDSSGTADGGRTASRVLEKDVLRRRRQNRFRVILCRLLRIRLELEQAEESREFPCLERPEQPRQKEVRRMQELLNMDGLHVKRQRGKSGRCL